MALIRYVSTEDRLDAFAIVADDAHGAYVWASDDDALFDGDERIATLLEFRTEEELEPPATAQEWVELLSQGLGNAAFEDLEVESFEAATTKADDDISLAARDAGRTREPLTGDVYEAFNEVSQDYPNLASGEDDEDDMAMTHLVLQALGPIDPEGPNGWLLRAIDGEPREGDENMYLDFGGNAPTAEEKEKK
jgi:hypothetical protein